MSSNNETNNPQNNSNNESDNIPLQSEFDSGSDVTSDQNKGNDKEKHTGKINQWKEYRKKWIDPLVIVTIVLALATFWLYKEAVKQGVLTEGALKEAVRSNSISEANLNLAKKQFHSNDSANKINLKISNNALQTQINSIKQTQFDFEIENRPFMVFINIHLDTSFKNNVINITYTGYNVGKFPAKVFYMATAINYGIDTSTTKLFKITKWTVRPSKEYLPNNAFLDGNVTLPSNKQDINFFKNGLIHIFLYFDIRYFSSVLKTTYSSYSVWQITLNDFKNIDVSAIENK